MSNVIGVPETSVWFSDYELNSHGIKALVFNAFNSNPNEMGKVNSTTKSSTFLNRLNKVCWDRKLFWYQGDGFDKMTGTVTEAIKGIEIL